MDTLQVTPVCCDGNFHCVSHFLQAKQEIKMVVL